MMQLLFKLFLACFETFLIIYFLNNLLTKIDELEHERKIAYIAYFVFQCITYLIDFPFFSTSYYYVLFALAIASLFYFNEIRIKLIATSMFVTLNYASKLLSTIIFSALANNHIADNPFTYVLNLPTQLIACIIMVFVISLIIALRKVSNNVVRVMVNTLIFILPLTILYVSMHLLENLQPVNLYFNITMLLFCYTFLLFFIIDQIIFSNANLLQSNLMHERLQMQSVYYKDIEKYNRNMSRYKHDMINHLDSVYGMLEKNEIEEAKHYLESISEKLNRVEAVINTGNSVIDVIYNAKASLAKSNHILCRNNIVVPPHLNIDSVDLSVILSNLLDNAIEASLKLEDNRMIESHIHIYKGNLFISVKNNYNGEIISSHAVYLTTKKDSHEHGIGLKNVQHVVTKYNGTQNVEHDEHTFTVSIMIPAIEN